MRYAEEGWAELPVLTANGVRILQDVGCYKEVSAVHKCLSKTQIALLVRQCC